MKSSQKRQVKVEWVFQPIPPASPMLTLSNGQKIRAGVAHAFFVENIDATKIWCSGCREHFKSWTELLKRHNLCQPRPGWPTNSPAVKRTKEKHMRKGYENWPLWKLKAWMKKYKPNVYQQLYGGA